MGLSVPLDPCLLHIHDLCKYNISLSLLSKLKDNDGECAIQRANAIVDFYYDKYHEQSVREIIDYLKICALFNASIIPFLYVLFLFCTCT